MKSQSENSVPEIRCLQRCINDLVSILAFPAIWAGREPFQIVDSFLDGLLRMLRLDFGYVRLQGFDGDIPVEVLRIAPSSKLDSRSQEIRKMMTRYFGQEPLRWPRLVRAHVEAEEIAMVPLRLGLQGEIGVVVAGCHRADFPQQTESLLLTAAANQASVALQESRLLSQQKRLATQLDLRIAERTSELAEANEVLRKEIAERRRAEEALKRTEVFLAEGQRLSSTGSFVWCLANDEITWSDELYRIFELDPPITPARIRTRVHPDDRSLFEKMVEQARNGSEDFEWQYRLVMSDGSIKHLHAVAQATRDHDGQLEYIAAVQDVTERRDAEEALDKARSQLSNVARVMSLGTLTASIAHEVNQPLSGIITNASTCLRMLNADPPNIDGARETARRTIRDGNRASDVITRLRSLFGKKNPPMEAVDLNEAAREVIALSSGELQRNRVLLGCELDSEIPFVTGDRVQLQQVILNLLRNASEAMSTIDNRPRELLIKTEREEGDVVRLSVRDTGVGFDPKAGDRLFEAFYTTKSDGMGMGLSVSRSIIESHSGRLWAQANEGPGATFSFSIPCRARAMSARAGAIGNANAA